MTQVEPFFAYRVIRAMTKSCATHDIGMDGFALVSLIGMQWDCIRYKRPVTYHYSVLVNLLSTPRTTLQRIEKKCIDAGWLTKTNQGKRKPCAYTVCIPSTAAELPDTPTDDGDEVGLYSGLYNGLYSGQKVGTSRAESGHKSGTKRAPFFPSSIPLPISKECASIPATEEPQTEHDEDLFEEFWEAYGKKVGRKETLAKWKTLSRVQQEAATDGASAYVAANPDPKYRKDPVRYLKGEHWNDVPVATATNPHPPESAAWWDWYAAHPEAMAK